MLLPLLELKRPGQVLMDKFVAGPSGSESIVE